jgi:pyridoxine 5'-phosphate synthase PdxJ
MARMTIDLEPLADLYGNNADLVKAMVKNAVACEIAGADGIVFNGGKDFDQTRRRAVTILVDSLEIGLAVRIAAEEKSLRILQDLKPAMAIISFDRDKKGFLASAITSLQVENVLVALDIPSEMEYVKEAAKLKSDYVVVNCAAYCAARTLNAQLDELDKIAKLAGLCSRLSLGVIAAGPFTPHHLSKMRNTNQIEEYITGLPFFSDALIHGYEKTITALKSSIT